MHESLIELISVIRSGPPEEVRQAKKAIEQLWEDNHFPHRTNDKEVLSVFVNEIKNFDTIPDIEHQVYFISILKWPFMAIGSEHFEEWSHMVIRLIQHPSGKIRQAILNATDWLIFSMYEIGFSMRKATADEIEKQAQNRQQFGEFVYEAERLSIKYHEPKFNRYKYVSSLPVGVYKSIQKLLTEVLLRSNHYQEIYVNYLKTHRPAEVVVNNQNTLPQIKLKYHSRKSGDDMTPNSGLACIECGKYNVKAGAKINLDADNKEVICEECAIDRYQNDYGFTSRQAATAHRRRLFDIVYLFQEIVTDAYMKQNNIADVDDLDFETIQFLFNVASSMYNEKLSRKQIIALENEPDQHVIESTLQKILEQK